MSMLTTVLPLVVLVGMAGRAHPLPAYFAAAACPNGEVFISAANGSDVLHSGCSPSLALKTVEQGQRVARATRASNLTGTVTVWLAAGNYELAATLALTGELDSNTTWAASTSSPTQLSAGKVVKGFKPCTTATNCPVTAAGVYSVNLYTAAGLSSEELGSLTPRGWPVNLL